ncbi:TIR domain-containing protein [Amphibacillus sp. MSJ-3]|uniref:TIR domain-containing protein n=1 Tax=Amphibacillus sp. MSJ-3 TaxID=2841505 RepID=UPI001C0F0891|nr:TIR domain-containing protein [Amphibacillus sp. MSJ-3]MBU5595325.1 TIR domain-containing protein [Amphibacillus sp. MSJ-3]
MSVNESNLRRVMRKDGELTRKLISIRKKRDSEMKKIERIKKKRNISNSDIQSLTRYQKNLLKYESEITKLTEKIRQNQADINKYQERIQKEQQKSFKKMVRAVEEQSSANYEYLGEVNELNSKLENLAMDIKDTVSEKELIEYDVFLSHSSLDKEIFVSELSSRLSDQGFKVFEDVKVFKIGDSQIDQMNMGILNSRFVIVFLSPNFIKSGWSEYEFKSFLNREINENRIILLPIWHEITKEEVQRYNPYIVDKFALDTSRFTMDEIVEHITQVIKSSLEEE